MPSFEEERAYYFANAVGRSVCPSVRSSVDQMVSDHYLENFTPQSFHISHDDLSLWNKNPIDFGFNKSKVKVTMVTCEKCKHGFCSLS